MDERLLVVHAHPCPRLARSIGRSSDSYRPAIGRLDIDDVALVEVALDRRDTDKQKAHRLVARQGLDRLGIDAYDTLGKTLAVGDPFFIVEAGLGLGLNSV